MKISKKLFFGGGIALSWVVVVLFTLYFAKSYLNTKIVIKYYPGDKDIVSYTEEHRGNYHVAKWFYKSGSIMSIEEHADYNKLSEKSFYEAGELRSIYPYKNGNVDGAVKEFYKDGRLRFSVEYKDGLRIGKLFIYYPDGKIAIEANYESKNGRSYLDGPFKTFYPDGNPAASGIIKNGDGWNGSFTSFKPDYITWHKKEEYLLEYKDGKLIKSSKQEKPFERGWMVSYLP